MGLLKDAFFQLVYLKDALGAVIEMALDYIPFL